MKDELVILNAGENEVQKTVSSREEKKKDGIILQHF